MLINLLNDMRQGIVSRESERPLHGLSREVKHSGKTRPIELFPHRASAEAANNMRMHRLPGETFSFTAKDKLGVDTQGYPVKRDHAIYLLDRMIAPTIKLRVS